LPRPTPYSCAIVGTGGIADIHAQAIADLATATLVGVVDIDRTRAELFAERWQTTAYSSLEELLDSVDVDLVHLCTPPGLHAEQAIACLERGIMPLIEKPPVLTLDQLDDLMAAERMSTTTVACIFQHRFGSAANTLRRWNADGRLGASLVAQCSTLWYRGDDYFDVPWRGTWSSEGGGPSMGHGIHQTDVMLSILGPWTSVMATAARRLRDTETEDVAAAVVTFADGTIATVVNSLLSPRETSILRFDFEYATVEVEHLYGYSTSDWRFTAAPGHEHLEAEWRAEAGDVPSGHAAQFAAIFDALDRGEQPPVTLAEAATTLELSAGIYASAFTGEAIERTRLATLPAFRRSMSGGLGPWSRKEPAL
jgi:predicted dehydrogenase